VAPPKTTKKNGKINFFDNDDGDGDIKNAFTLINEKSQQNTQKTTKPFPAKPVVQNKPMMHVEKKNEPQPKNILPPKLNKQTVHNNTQQKDNFANFDSNFENIFDSLASAPKNKNDDKKTNYFDQ